MHSKTPYLTQDSSPSHKNKKCYSTVFTLIQIVQHLPPSLDRLAQSEGALVKFTQSLIFSGVFFPEHTQYFARTVTSLPPASPQLRLDQCFFFASQDKKHKI